MIQKLLDETHWSRFLEMRELVFKNGKDDLSLTQFPVYPGSSETRYYLKNFIDSCFELTESKAFYNCASYSKVIDEEIEKNGFDNLKSEVINVFIIRFQDFIFYNPNHKEEATLKEEIVQLKDFLNETTDIQEIFDTYQIYYFLMREAASAE